MNIHVSYRTRLMAGFLLGAAFLSGSVSAATPSNTYCSTDSGVTWTPCGSGSGGGGTSTTPVPSSSSTAGIAPDTSASLQSNRVLKASAGNLYGFLVTVDSATGPVSSKIMVFNATSAPADGAVTPALCINGPAPGQTLSYDPGAIPDYFSTGITIALSSNASCYTKTASATATFSGFIK